MQKNNGIANLDPDTYTVLPTPNNDQATFYLFILRAHTHTDRSTHILTDTHTHQASISLRAHTQI